MVSVARKRTSKRFPVALRVEASLKKGRLSKRWASAGRIKCLEHKHLEQLAITDPAYGDVASRKDASESDAGV